MEDLIMFRSSNSDDGNAVNFIIIMLRIRFE